MDKQNILQVVFGIIISAELLSIAYMLFDEPKSTTINETTCIEQSSKISAISEKVNYNNLVITKDISAGHQDSRSKIQSKKNLRLYVIQITPAEFDLLVQLVQHEVGTSASYYPGYDFNYIQQCMAKLVVNRVRHSKLSVTEVIKQKGQFENWQRSSKFSKDHEQTRRNVEIVLSGKDNISNKLLFQMSFKKMNLSQSLKRMQTKVGKVKPYHYVVSVDKRFMIFATTAKK